MPLQLINGVNGTADLTIGGASYAGVLFRWTAQVDRRFIDEMVFTSGIWADEFPVSKQLTGDSDGFLSKGDAISDPLAVMADDELPSAFELVATTGCMYSFDGWASRATAGVQARAPSTFGLAFRSKGEVVTTWIVV